MALSFYRQLYSDEGGASFLPSMLNLFTPLSEEEFRFLDTPFSMDKVRKALFLMAPFKAPGPDGFQAIFYQRAWDIVGPQVSSSLLAFLSGGEIPEGICDILITLLHKIVAPEQISQFRPISLCNVAFKIITKVLVNRMKMVLPKLVSSMQSSFIPRRQLNDNVVVL